MAWLPDPLMLAKGVLLGLGAAVPIGPVNVEIARRTLRGGFLAGFALGCGAVTVDVMYAILSSLGVRLVLDQPRIYWALVILGVGLLVYLGVGSWIDAIRAIRWRKAGAEEAQNPLPSASAHVAYVTGLLMTLLNPMTLAFWFTVVPSLAGQNDGQHAARDLPMICIGVFIGTIAWVVTFAGTLAIAGRWRKSLWMFLADAFGGTTLLLFAGYALWKSLARHG